MRAKRSAEDKENVSTASATHESELLTGLSMYRTRFPYCPPEVFLPKKKIRPSTEGAGRSQAPMKNRHNYLKPGTLAQWRDQRKRLAEVTAVANMERPAVVPRVAVTPPLSNSPERVPVGIVPRSGGPACLRRKKLLAPQFSLSAQGASTSDPVPMVEEPAVAPPATPTQGASALQTPVEVDGELTPFDNLPVELLVRIVCFLDHAHLQPVFHVSKALRQAVIIARQEYFDFTTPGKFQPSEYRKRLLSDGKAPAAPIKHTPKSARIPEAVLAELSTRLFPIVLPAEPSEAQRLSWLANRPNRTRALFSEEELCKAIAENTL